MRQGQREGVLKQTLSLDEAALLFVPSLDTAPNQDPSQEPPREIPNRLPRALQTLLFHSGSSSIQINISFFVTESLGLSSVLPGELHIT